MAKQSATAQDIAKAAAKGIGVALILVGLYYMIGQLFYMRAINLADTALDAYKQARECVKREDPKSCYDLENKAKHKERDFLDFDNGAWRLLFPKR